MTRQSLLATLALLGAVVPSGNTALAAPRYNYGGGGYGAGEAGFLLFLEAGLANPRNTDNIVAASGPNVVIPEWDDDLAGRLGVGYRFDGGGELVFTFWGFETDQDAEGVGTFSFPIGPADGFSYDVTTEIQARTADASFGSAVQATDALRVEWSGGLRYAGFEETTTGTYGTSGGPRAADKSLESDMIGARLAGRATYRRGQFSVGAGLGLSLVDGEIEARSSLTPQPPGTSPLALTDDSRSGSLLDLEVRATWHARDDGVSVWIGWEEQVWDDIAADLARNLPGSDVIYRTRDSVTFSWVKAGLGFRF
jgi:hypothetical protein